MNTLSCLIPVFQNGGRVDVPVDDWAELASLVREKFNGALRVTESNQSGFKVVSNENGGLPCLLLEMTVPEGPSRDEVIDVVDGPIDDIVRRNLVPTAETATA
jgi:hypothetical protein